MYRTKGLCKIAGFFWLIPMITVLAKSVDYSDIFNQTDSRSGSDGAVINSFQKQFGDKFQPRSSYSTSIVDEDTDEDAKAHNLKGKHRQKRQSTNNFDKIVAIFGFSVQYESDKKRVEYRNGHVFILEGLSVSIRFYGKFKKSTFFRYSSNIKCEGEENSESQELHLEGPPSSDGTTFIAATVDLTIPPQKKFLHMYFCLQYNDSDVNNNGIWESQGLSEWLHVQTEATLLPLWVHILLIIFLLLLSGLFSGLNLGLMSLNKTDLKIIINTGNPAERGYASKIAPVRNHGNFLLCSLLFSNVLVNASLTILVDELTTGLVAIIMSTMAIVIFGEIIPQALCSRHGLAVGAKTIYITKFFMALTFPLAYPLSKLLDRLLGEEIGNVYTRERLKELLKVTRDYHGLENEEVGIISGALDMKTKTVKDIMTEIDEVFMLPIDSNLDYETIGDIEYHGFSRIPVYDQQRYNVVDVLNVKQLTLLDAKDNTPIRTMVEYYKNTLFYVFENTRLDYMFKAFREGSRGHMAFVQKVNDEGPGDPHYETIGVVTMEDVLEELLQQEIMDESDIGKTARGTTARKERPRDPFKVQKRSRPVIDLPPPLVLAASQYLTTSVLPFHRDFVSESVMKRLVKIYARETKPPKARLHAASTILYLYETDRPADYFIMILEGRVEVFVGKENLNFEAGPFHHFGADFLMVESAKENPDEVWKIPTIDDALMKKRTFLPDYTVKVITDVVYIRLKYSNYRSCRAATQIEKNFKEDNWPDEIEKMIIEDDDAEPEIRKIETIHVATNQPSLLTMEIVLDTNSTVNLSANNRKTDNDKGSKSEAKNLL